MEKSKIENRKSKLLYDVHTHVGLDQAFNLRGWWPYAATAQDLLEAMDAHGIDRAVCFPFCVSSAYDPFSFADRKRVELLPGRVPYDRENPLLVQEVERLDVDKRLRVFAMFDPSRRVAEQVEKLRVLRPRLAGLKVQATVIESPIPALLGEGRELMYFAEEHRLPVLIHTSVFPDDPWSQVRDCLRVAETYPKARFNLAHSLRFDLPSLKQARHMDNVWIDCAAHLNHCRLAVMDHPAVAPKGERVEADFSDPVDAFQAVYDVIGPKYLWGSDNPFQSWCDDTIRQVHSYKQEADVLHALRPDVKHSVATAAPEAWLGISGGSTS
jgi:hypothetical protein